MNFLLVIAIVAVVIVVAAAVIAARQKEAYAQANQVVPGTETQAPAAWAGAHTQEARLHRRIRDAVAASRAGATPATERVRAELEGHALALDERLVKVAAIAERLRAEPLAALARDVDRLEELVAELARVGANAHGAEVTAAALDDLRARTRFLEEATAELDQIIPDPGGVTALRREMDAVESPEQPGEGGQPSR